MQLITFIKEQLHKRKTLLKVVIVGGCGTLIQAGLLLLFVEVLHLYPVLANTAAAEIAIICNFILNNHWTFNKQSNHSLPRRFFIFNMSTLGSVIIQALVIALGIHLLGGRWYFIYAGIGILLGLVLNYTVYTRVIWRNHKI